ncbi:MAG: hypothetical protein ABIT05_09060 [Chitinophagaceae bacterium]
MGYMTGGFIFKKMASMPDEEVLDLLDSVALKYSGDISLEEATSGSFHGIALARIEQVLFVLGKDGALSSSFGEKGMSRLDQRLEIKSRQGDILCFLINSVSDTYAWSIFRKGEMIHAKSSAGGKLISEVGATSEYEKGVELNEDGVITLIENFGGHGFFELVFEKNIRARVYL